ncbi:hypothetical protein JOQ06_012959, partial [Pogonophryne albipinna]
MSAIKDLRRHIQRQLHQLINFNESDVLYKLAAWIDDEAKEELPGDDATDVEHYDFIVDFLKSDQLASQEDQGMSRLLVFNDLITELQQLSEAVEEHQEPRLEKKTQIHIAEVDEDDSDSSDDEYTVQPVPCYRLVRPQQTEHRQAVHRPETQLRARACEFHPAEGAAEDVAVEEEPQDRHMEGMVADEEGHQVEAET